VLSTGIRFVSHRYSSPPQPPSYWPSQSVNPGCHAGHGSP
jgi:hypothetical protein